MTTERILRGRQSQRGVVLPLTVILLVLLALMGMAILDYGLNERMAASGQILAARAFAAAEAGAQKAFYYLTSSGPGGTPADGSTWRTAAYTESVPAPNGGDSFTVSVQDGTGVQAGNVVIVSTATVGGHRRRIQMIVSGPGNLGPNAISTPGPVGPSGVAAGSVAGKSSGKTGTTVQGMMIDCN